MVIRNTELVGNWLDTVQTEPNRLNLTGDAEDTILHPVREAHRQLSGLYETMPMKPEDIQGCSIQIGEDIEMKAASTSTPVNAAEGVQLNLSECGIRIHDEVIWEVVASTSTPVNAADVMCIARMLLITAEGGSFVGGLLAMHIDILTAADMANNPLNDYLEIRLRRLMQLPEHGSLFYFMNSDHSVYGDSLLGCMISYHRCLPENPLRDAHHMPGSARRGSIPRG